MVTPRTYACVALVIATGCGGCEGGNGTTSDDAGSPYVLAEVGAEEDAGAPCPTTNPTDPPVIALERTGVWETYVAPRESGRSGAPQMLALDYEVTPAPRVAEARLTLDFEPTPGPPQPDVVLDERCPTGFDAETLYGASETETVVAALITTRNADGADIRTGRVSGSNGTASITLRTDTFGDDTGDWWFLFEPATGTNRLDIRPADVTRTTFAVDGIPDINGVVALVQTDLLRLSAGTRTIYAPPGFAANWRALATGWRERIRQRGEDANTVRDLHTIASSGSEPAATAVLDGTILHDFSSNPRLVVRTRANGSDGTLTVACPTRLRFAVSGMARLVVDDGVEPVALNAGDVEVVEPACSGTEAELTLEASPLVQRSQSVAITWLGGE